MGLKAIKLGEISGNNSCAINNGGCSQICLYRHNETYVCACQIDYDLNRDKKTCMISDEILFYTHKNTIGKVSVENMSFETSQTKIPITGIKQARYRYYL